MNEIDIIIDVVRREFSVSLEDILSPSRRSEYVKVRQISLKLCKELFEAKYSIMTLGEHINRDHATVLHAIKEATNYISSEKVYREIYFKLKDKCMLILEDEDKKANYIKRLEDIEFANLQLN